MDEREMYDEINALMVAVAKALDFSEVEVITAIEQGRLSLEMKTDADGSNYLEAICDGKTAHVYAGAIFRPGCSPDGDDGHGGGYGGGGCGGGCSCGG